MTSRWQQPARAKLRNGWAGGQSGAEKSRCSRIHAFLGLALCFPTAATAQAVPPSSPPAEALPEVVVTGERVSPEELHRRAEDFVRRVGVVTGDRQAARWRDPICPHIIGLSPVLSQKVEDKFRSIARAAGAPLAPTSRCEKNVIIAFTGDAGAVIRSLASRSPRQLSEVPSGARADLLEGKAPIRWFYTTESRSKDGLRGTGSQPQWSSGNGQGGGSIIGDNGKSVSLLQYGSGIISTSGIRVLTGATVVIDVNLAEGKTLNAVASYAALVALSEVRLSGEKPAHSILGMFDRSEAAESLSEFDLRFLNSLYALPLDRNPRSQRGRIVRDLISSNP